MRFSKFTPLGLVLLIAVPGVLLSCHASRLGLSSRGQIHLLFPGGKPHATDGYAGNKVCRRCHEAQYSFWNETSHARSLLTLKDLGMEKDPVCLRCHATGYGIETGYDESRDNGLDSVGCEACHGPSEEHSRTPEEVRTSGGLQKDCPPCVVNRICLLCHTAARNADFTLKEYFDTVACPGLEEQITFPREGSQ